MIYYIFARTTKRASHPAFHIELSQLRSNIYHGLSRTASLKRSPDGELGRQGPSNYSSGLIFPKLRFWKLAQLLTLMWGVMYCDERTKERMTQNTEHHVLWENTGHHVWENKRTHRMPPSGEALFPPERKNFQNWISKCTWSDLCQTPLHFLLILSKFYSMLAIVRKSESEARPSLSWSIFFIVISTRSLVGLDFNVDYYADGRGLYS